MTALNGNPSQVKVTRQAVKNRPGTNAFEESDSASLCFRLEKLIENKIFHSGMRLEVPQRTLPATNCISTCIRPRQVRAALACPCHAPTLPFFSRPRHSTSVERRPVGYLPAFGFFRLPRGVPRRLLSEAYQSQTQVASVQPNNVCHGRGKGW